jgi:hypothetical protein
MPSIGGKGHGSHSHNGSTHRGNNVDHGNNVDQHSEPRNKGKYSILYLHFFRGYEC